MNRKESGEQKSSNIKIRPHRNGRIRLSGILLIGVTVLVIMVLTIILISIRSSALFYVSEPYVGNSDVQFQWTPSDHDDFDRYEIHRNDEFIDAIHDRNTTKYLDGSVERDTEYEYRVEEHVWNHQEEETYLRNSDTIEDITTGEVQGTVVFNTFWTSSDGPYNLSGHVSAGNGVNLLINKGTTIYTNGRQIYDSHPVIEEVTVYGGLFYEDLTSLSITDCKFYYSPEDPIHYPGLQVFNCSNVEIEGNRFQDYESGYPGIKFDEYSGAPVCTDVLVRDNDFLNCRYGIGGRKLHDAEFSGNHFIDSYVSLSIQENLSESRIHNNQFERDSGLEGYINGLFVTSFNSLIYSNVFTGLQDPITFHGEGSKCYDNDIFNCTDGIFVGGTRQKVFDNTLDSAGEHGIGIEFYGTQNEVFDNYITEFDRAGIKLQYPCSDCVIYDNEIRGGGYGIYSPINHIDNITIQENHIHNNSDDGIFLEQSTNFTVENNTILDHDRGNGITLHYLCFNNTIRGNTISNVAESGILMGWGGFSVGNRLNTFEENVISDAGTGIYLQGIWDVNYGFLCQDNNTFQNNDVIRANYGVLVEGSSNNTFSNNKLLEAGTNGIQVDFFYSDRWEKYAYSRNNLFHGNTITTVTDEKYDILEFCLEHTSNIYSMNTLGISYPTTISIEEFSGTMKARAVEAVPVQPQPPEFNSEYFNISNFLEVDHFGERISITFHYTDQQLAEMGEGGITGFRYNETDHWRDGTDEPYWLENQIVRPDQNEFEMDVILCGENTLFAPMISLPVHNTDTQLDYTSIQDSINDPLTIDGHSIVVDPAYSLGGTKENIVVNKELTIRSAAGDPLLCAIHAADPDDDVVKILVADVQIIGFTVTGSSGIGNTGIRVEDASGVTLRSMIIEGNGDPGILFDSESITSRGDGTETILTLENVKVRNNQGDGIGSIGNNILTIQGTDNEIDDNGGHGIYSFNGEVNILGGTDIRNNNDWGIKADDDGTINIQNSALRSVQDNGLGGILGEGGITGSSDLLVENNDGPGIVAGGTEPLILENIIVRNNTGDGIGTIDSGDVLVRGTSSEIVYNGGHGIRAINGDITIQGTDAVINANGGWGLRTEGGKIMIPGNAHINGNMEGGIIANNGISGSGLEVYHNNGPGIVCMDGEIRLISSSVTDNNDHGVHAIGCDVIVEGEGNEFRENKGWGIYNEEGSVQVQEARIDNNLYGGLLGAKGVVTDDCIIEWNVGSGVICFEGQITMKDVVIENNIGHGIHSMDADVSITGNTNRISGNHRWGMMIEGGKRVILKNTRIEKNELGGIFLDGEEYFPEEETRGRGTEDTRSGSRGEIEPSLLTGNVISGNMGDGIRLVNGSNPVINYNSIVGNDGVGINSIDDTTQTIDARYNWWGTDGSPSISGEVDTTYPLTNGLNHTLMLELVPEGGGTGSGDFIIRYSVEKEVTVQVLFLDPGPQQTEILSQSRILVILVNDTTAVNWMNLTVTVIDLVTTDSYPEGMRLAWFDGTDWKPCSSSDSFKIDWIILFWVNISADTDPNTTDLNALRLAVLNGEASGPGDDDGDDDGIGFLMVGVIIIIVIVVVGVLMEMGIISLDSLSGKGKQETRTDTNITATKKASDTGTPSVETSTAEIATTSKDDTSGSVSPMPEEEAPSKDDGQDDGV